MVVNPSTNLWSPEDLRWQSETLCSQRDPIREAQTWVNGQDWTSDYVWVLGLGAGFHLVELLTRFTDMRVFVIDHRKDLALRFREKFPELQSRVMIEICQNEKEFLASRQFQIAGPRHFHVTKFQPALQHHVALYEELHQSLLGQTPAAFAFFAEKIGLEVSSDFFQSQKSLHVKEIEAQMMTSTKIKTQKLVRILRELVS